jgi:hypothetical protein
MTKVVYIGQLWQGGTCLARAEILRERGWEVVTFDTTPYPSAGSRLMRSHQHRFSAGPAVERFNRDLMEFIGHHSDTDVIWSNKGRRVFASTLGRIKTSSRAVLVHHSLAHLHCARRMETAATPTARYVHQAS